MNRDDLMNDENRSDVEDRSESKGLLDGRRMIATSGTVGNRPTADAPESTATTSTAPDRNDEGETTDDSETDDNEINGLFNNLVSFSGEPFHAKPIFWQNLPQKLRLD